MSNVEESDLDFSQFHCCGGEDLYPFECPTCRRLMVFCYECDTLYDDLGDLACCETEVNNFDATQPFFACPQCGHPFDDFFIRDGLHKVERQRWLAAGLGHLLRPPAGTP